MMNQFTFKLKLIRYKFTDKRYQGKKMSVKSAQKKVEQKFKEIGKALGIDYKKIYSPDANGVAFVGFNPSVLYAADASKLEKIKKIDIPTTFFVTGDAADTKNAGEINNKFSKYKTLGMPNSHKLAQSLICRTILINPVYINGKPLIPIGIDNYVFVSPKDVLKRFQVIKMYKEAVEGQVPKRRLKLLERAIKYAFDENERKYVKSNKNVIKQLARIFPNALNTVLTNEPPSSITGLGKVIAGNLPMAVIQMEYTIHPTYFDFFKDFYYLYMSDDRRNTDERFPECKGALYISALPIMEDFLSIGRPLFTRKKRVLLSSGGAAGRVFRMAKELKIIHYKNPVEYVLLTGVPKNSAEYNKIVKIYRKLSTDRVMFTPVERISTSELAKLYQTCHATIGLPGMYTTFGSLASGRPFGAVIDMRKTKDRIFTDHVIGNAYFSRDVFEYPAIVIKDRIKSKDLIKLLDEDFVRTAYKKATQKGGIRDMFRDANIKWRMAFINFIK